MFIVGYSVASVTFGHLVHFYNPFKLIAVGLTIWVLSVLVSGWAPHYWILVLGRIFSGVGEASFQTVVPPYIDTFAPPEKRGIWLAIFFSAIPVGTAMGYVWGGNISSALSWRWAFYLEVLPMVPFAAMIFFLPYPKTPTTITPEAKKLKRDEESLVMDSNYGIHSAENTSDSPMISHVSGNIIPLEVGDGLETSKVIVTEGGQYSYESLGAQDSKDKKNKSQPSFFQEIKDLLLNPLFMAIIFGYGGYTAVLAGVGAFGPMFTKGLEVFDSEEKASTYFGGCIALAGAIGTPLGGWLLDRGTKKAILNGALGEEQKRALEIKEKRALRAKQTKQLPDMDDDIRSSGKAPILDHDDNEDGYGEPKELDATDPLVLDLKLNIALPQAVALCIAGLIGCFAAILLAVKSGMAFFGLLGLGALALTATTAGVNLAIMASVPEESRAFALGVGTLLVHAFGDVPAPPIIGAIVAKLAPEECETPGVEETCSRSAEGLQKTLGLCVFWLLWPTLLWAAGWFISKWNTKRRNAKKKDSLLGSYETEFGASSYVPIQPERRRRGSSFASSAHLMPAVHPSTHTYTETRRDSMSGQSRSRRSSITKAAKPPVPVPAPAPAPAPAAPAPGPERRVSSFLERLGDVSVFESTLVQSHAQKRKSLLVSDVLRGALSNYPSAEAKSTESRSHRGSAASEERIQILDCAIASAVNASPYAASPASTGTPNRGSSLSVASYTSEVKPVVMLGATEPIIEVDTPAATPVTTFLNEDVLKQLQAAGNESDSDEEDTNPTPVANSSTSVLSEPQVPRSTKKKRRNRK